MMGVLSMSGGVLGIVMIASIIGLLISEILTLSRENKKQNGANGIRQNKVRRSVD